MTTITHDFHPVSLESSPVQVEERDGKPERIYGHAAVFYDESDPGTEYRLGRFIRERIGRGAFDGAMKRPDDVRALRDHDPSLLLGRRQSGTLLLSVDDRGLAYEIEPDTTTVGADTKKMVRRGDLTGSSFGFVVEKESFEDDGEEVIRTVEAVNPLIDVGPVTFPAFTASESTIKRMLGEMGGWSERDISEDPIKRKLSCVSSRLKWFIGEHRDEDIGQRLETRAAKFGIVVPKELNPDTIAKTIAESRRRRLGLIERELRKKA